jgi:protein translocase SecG subunit
MDNIIAIAQIVIATLLIILILLQQRGTALGSAFGQDGGSGGGYTAQRGLQKKIFWATIAIAGLFLALTIVNLFQQ